MVRAPGLVELGVLLPRETGAIWVVLVVLQQVVQALSPAISPQTGRKISPKRVKSKKRVAPLGKSLAKLTSPVLLPVTANLTSCMVMSMRLRQAG